MGKTLKFDYLDRDRLLSRVSVDYGSGTVSVENFTDDPVEQAFGKMPLNLDSLEWFWRDRVIPETRVNIKEILDFIGLDRYDAREIARITHGRLFDDDYWIRFEGETLSWNDVKGKK